MATPDFILGIGLGLGFIKGGPLTVATEPTGYILYENGDRILGEDGVSLIITET